MLRRLSATGITRLCLISIRFKIMINGTILMGTLSKLHFISIEVDEAIILFFVVRA